MFATGVALLYVGPSGSQGLLMSLHKVSFVLWLGATGLHVLGHLAELPSALRADRRSSARGTTTAPGAARGPCTLAAAIAAGVIVAVVVESQFSVWAHYHHGG